MKRFGLPLVVAAVGIFFATALFAALSGSLDEKAIIQRLQPVGIVNLTAGVGTAGVVQQSVVTVDIGQQHYEQVCHICHEAGLAGAPKFGDKSDWVPRIAEGMDTMLKRAIEGYRAMPPKGTCISCSDEDIKKTVEYMVSHSQ